MQFGGDVVRRAEHVRRSNEDENATEYGYGYDYGKQP
jgi:hypothetical protein